MKKIMCYLVAAFGIAAFTAAASVAADKIADVNPAKALDIIKNNKNVMIIDVRTPGEYNEGHFEGAINLDYNGGVFKEKISGYDKNNAYVLFCRSGRRSKAALDIMKELGFKEVYNIEGGMLKWNEEKLPLKK